MNDNRVSVGSCWLHNITNDSIVILKISESDTNILISTTAGGKRMTKDRLLKEYRFSHYVPMPKEFR